MWERMDEKTWSKLLYAELDKLDPTDFDFVTGPGRSGAVAAVYASHYLGIPFKPHKAGNYDKDTACLVVDTVEYTGRTLRKAVMWYAKRGLYVRSMYAVKEERGHYFKMWYEAI